MKRSMLLIVLVTVGCSSPPRGPSEVCEPGDECNGGLSCLNVSISDSGGQCRVARAICSAPCSNDVDCEAIGNGMSCIDSCGSKICGRPDLLAEALVQGATCSDTSQCRGELECMPVEQGECGDVRKACTKSCEEDADCTDLGDFTCIVGCGTSQVCG